MKVGDGFGEGVVQVTASRTEFKKIEFLDAPILFFVCTVFYIILHLYSWNMEMALC